MIALPFITRNVTFQKVYNEKRIILLPFARLNVWGCPRITVFNGKISTGFKARLFLYKAPSCKS